VESSVSNLPDCSLSQCKRSEQGGLACPPSHPDHPNHCLTTCGTSSWAANKPYFTPAPHQPDHVHLWFHTLRKKVISAKCTLQQTELKGKDPGTDRTLIFLQLWWTYRLRCVASLVGKIFQPGSNIKADSRWWMYLLLLSVPSQPSPLEVARWMFSILVPCQIYFPGFLLSEVEDPGMFDSTGSNHGPTPMTAAVC